MVPRSRHLGAVASPDSPAGRLGTDFLRDLGRDYRADGAYAISQLRKNEPAHYFRLLLSLVPDGGQTGQGWIEGLSDEELDALRAHVRAQLAKFESSKDE
jgi:hypothetical protein